MQMQRCMLLRRIILEIFEIFPSDFEINLRIYEEMVFEKLKKFFESNLELEIDLEEETWSSKSWNNQRFWK